MPTTTQIVRIQGRRVRLTTRNGRVTTKPAPELEWKLQAAQCRRLRGIPGILYAGSMEAGRRGPQAQIQAKATGLVAGEPDLRIYLPGGRCAFIENKSGNGRLSAAQIERHAALRAFGFEVEVIRAATEDEAADKAEAFVLRLLAANDNCPQPAKNVAKM